MEKSEIQEELKDIFSSWHSYPKLYALGHANLAGILDNEVLVEEKIDGSQFSWGIFNGELRCKSKGAIINILAPEKMFIPAVETVKRLQTEEKLKEGWTYRAEYLKVPKHNALAYDRIPAHHLIGFDINTGQEKYLTYEEKVEEFGKLSLETVPILHKGKIGGYEIFRGLLEITSILGGQKIEGVVIKNYLRFGKDGKALMGKFVSEAFKEIRSSAWKESNPGQGDIIENLISKFKTPARWAKSVQHLKEKGEVKEAPEDISALIKEINIDTLSECKDEIKEILFEWAWSKVSRGITSGFPQWYKEELAKKAFNQ